VSGPSAAQRRTLLAAVGLALLVVPLCAAGWGDDWDAIREATSSVRTVKAEFVQEKRLPILSRPLRSEGAFFFRRPGDVRWEYRSPVASVLLLHGNDVRRFLRRDGAWVQEAGAGMEAMRVVLDEIALWLAGDFESSTAFAPTLKPGTPTTIELVPREDAVRRFVTRVVLTLGDTPGAIASIDIFEGEQASTHIEFHGTELNGELADSVFTTVP